MAPTQPVPRPPLHLTTPLTEVVPPATHHGPPPVPRARGAGVVLAAIAVLTVLLAGVSALLWVSRDSGTAPTSSARSRGRSSRPTASRSPDPAPSEQQPPPKAPEALVWAAFDAHRTDLQAIFAEALALATKRLGAEPLVAVRARGVDTSGYMDFHREGTTLDFYFRSPEGGSSLRVLVTKEGPTLQSQGSVASLDPAPACDVRRALSEAQRHQPVSADSRATVFYPFVHAETWQVWPKGKYPVRVRGRDCAIVP